MSVRVTVLNNSSVEIAVTTRTCVVSGLPGRSFAIYTPSPAIFDGEIPANALLGDNGLPLLDDDGNYLLRDD